MPQRCLSSNIDYFEFSMNDEQKEELEALKAIFDSDFTDIASGPPCFMINLTDLDIELKGILNMKITLPERYPNVGPLVEIPNRSNVLSALQCEELLNQLNEVVEENLEMPMVYTLVESAKDWINNHYKCTDASFIEAESSQGINTDDQKNLIEVHLQEPKRTGGRWDLVIGLIGKPSAGKSTFFNAATNLDMAKTGSHPFTTIEPNIGKAFYTIPCPCTKLETKCNAAYGHDWKGERYVPVLVKDVAGLVPGACEGKGRGNRFLNDLCDADVLIHVVDASGNTNEKGEQTSGYDPGLDVVWLRNEIHRWIFDNIMDKWDSIKRRPQKLVDMFTGYHTTPATIHYVLQNSGIGDSEMSDIANWKEDIIHKIVNNFIASRFPIYLVLNKADVATSQENIQKIQQQFPEYSSLSVSSWAESLLQDLHKKGIIEYSCGNNNFNVLSASKSPMADVLQKLDLLKKNVLGPYSSTNVQHALSEAVALINPTYAFPVTDLDMLTSIDKYKGEEAGILRDCVILKPCTSCEELYTAMLHYPLLLVAGDFVRAECLNEDGEKRIMKKTEVIGDNNTHNRIIVKIMTNRKVTPCKRR